MIRPCSETPAYNTPSGKSCVDEIAEKFAFSRTLGQGKQGVVFEVIRKQQVMAVKVVPMGVDGINEIETQCLLNGLNDQTGVFLHIYGWQVCENMPAGWADFVRLQTKERLLFIFMEKTIKSWEDVDLKPHEKKAALFLLIHGLMVARREFNGFSHDDIHKENIMLQSIELKKTIQLVEGYLVGPNLRFVPKYIDYGFSFVGYEEEDEEEEEDELFGSTAQTSTDLSSLEYLFEDAFTAEFFNSREFTTARQSDIKDYIALQTLLDMDFFREYHKTENNHIQGRCIVCSTNRVRYQWPNTDYRFCSKSCGNFWGQGVGQFIVAHSAEAI